LLKVAVRRATISPQNFLRGNGTRQPTRTPPNLNQRGEIASALVRPWSVNLMVGKERTAWPRSRGKSPAMPRKGELASIFPQKIFTRGGNMHEIFEVVVGATAMLVIILALLFLFGMVSL